MLVARPRGWLSWVFEVCEGEELVGEVRLSAWRERGSVSVGSAEYMVARDGLFGPFLLQGETGTIAEAVKPSGFTRSFELVYGGRQLVLKAGSIWSRRFVLVDGEAEIGSIAPMGVFSRRACADLPTNLPFEFRLFAVWLCLMMWRRQRQTTGNV